MNGILALIISNIIWGAGAPIFKHALTNIPPFTLAFIRFFFASFLFIPFVLQSKIKIARKDFFEILLAGFFGIGINVAFFFLGLQRASSINSQIINAAGPIFLFFIAVIFFKEKLIKKVSMGMILSFFGILVVVFSPILMSKSGFATGTLEGNIFYICATIGAIMQPIILKNVFKRVRIQIITFWMFFVGAVCFFPFMVYELQHWSLQEINSTGVFGIMYGIFGSSFLAYTLFNYGVAKSKLQEVGLFTYITPLAATLVAIPLIHEYPTLYDFVGGMLICIGILVAEGKLYQHTLHKES